jgi:UDP-N-acetylmuramoyl-tripeptide--D-alanyl-D-alanine ligase
MLELGPASETLHRELGTVAAAGGVDQLVCVGSQARLIAEAARKAGMAAGAILHFPTAADAAAEVQQYLREGDLILLKASRGIHLETIAAALASSLSPAPPAKKVAS